VSGEQLDMWSRASLLREEHDDGTYPEGFWEWLEDNLHILDAFLQIAVDTKRAGVPRWSSDAICHVLRWQTAVRERGQKFLKINDHATAGLARLALAMRPDLAGFFTTRTPPAKQLARRLPDASLYQRDTDEAECAH
jgi:hypothetical protein